MGYYAKSDTQSIGRILSTDLVYVHKNNPEDRELTIWDTILHRAIYIYPLALALLSYQVKQLRKAIQKANPKPRDNHHINIHMIIFDSDNSSLFHWMIITNHSVNMIRPSKVILK